MNGQLTQGGCHDTIRGMFGSSRVVCIVSSFILLFSLVAAGSAFGQKKPPKPPPPPPGELTKAAIAKQIAEGRRLLSKGSASKAEALFRTLIKRAPKSALAYNELGVTLFQQGATEASIEPFKQAVKLNKKLAHAWANLAEAQRLSKRYKKAALSYHRFLQLNKGDRYAIYGMALCFEGYEQFDKAMKTLRVAERAARGHAKLLARVTAARKRIRVKIAEARLPILQRADRHLIAGRWESALGLYETALTKAKGDATLLGRRGLVKAILGNLAGARTDLEGSLLADPKGPTARAAYALVLDALGAKSAQSVKAGDAHALLSADRAALAHKAYSLNLADSPEKPDSLVGRGEASLRMGQLETALMDFTAARKAKGAAAGRAEAHLLSGSEADAKEAAAEAKAPVPLADLPLWRRSLLTR